MDRLEEILNRIVKWGESDENVRAMLLQGSLSHSDSDDLSDLDINIFVKDLEPLTNEDSWISDIEKVWVYSPDKHEFSGITYPQRLVIYDQGTKVDFGLRTDDIIEELGKVKYYDDGFKILIDKDGKLAKMPSPTLTPFRPKKPTEEEFLHVIKEYWFEEYHVAKYLKREDLWLVKFRDWSIKYYLLVMMEWYMMAKNDWNYDVKWNGKHIKKWLDKEYYDRLFGIYSHFDTEDGWKALEENNTLFRDLAT